MKKYIITIGREFGCGARDISRELARELGCPLYDKDLVDMAARKAGISVDFMRNSDEDRMTRPAGLFAQFGYGSSTAFLSDEAIQAQAEVIREIAERGGSAIIFGRCADYILREYPNIISFFLYAPKKYRIRHVSVNYHLTEREAMKLIRRVDRQRHDYYKYVTGHNRGDREEKNLLIDIAKFGTEGTVKLMCDALNIVNKADETSEGK